MGPAQIDAHWPPSPGNAIKTHLAAVVCMAAAKPRKQRRV